MILLDTHVLVWLATEPTKLSKLARSAIRRASRAGGIGISAITLWELAWLATHGRLRALLSFRSPRRLLRWLISFRQTIQAIRATV